MCVRWCWVFLFCFFTAQGNQIGRPGPRYEVKEQKTNAYISSGFFAGGDKSTTIVKLKDIRCGKPTKEYERIVLDLESQTEKQAMPYFQVQVAPEEGRMVLSVWADVQYDFDIQKTQKTFLKSKKIKKLNVVPRLEDGLAIVEFTLHPDKAKNIKFEVFQLYKPNRIIVDLL